MNNGVCLKMPRTLYGKAARERIQQSGDKPLVVQFFAHWCGHCQATNPEIDKTQQALCEQADVIRVDVDTNPDLADEYNVKGLPTVAVFRNGKQIGRMEGAGTADKFVALVGRSMKKLEAGASKFEKAAAKVAAPAQGEEP